MKRKGIFDEFFKEFGEMDEVFEKLFEGIKYGQLKEGKEPLYYGFSVHVGSEGVPKVTHFGNIKPELTGEVYSEIREPFCDVILDKKEKAVIVTLEMPGIEKKDINIDATEDELEVKAETESRGYHKKLHLEHKIKSETIKAVYNNGVLEIKAELKEPLEKKRKKVEVE